MRRRKLLATVSAATLLAAGYSMNRANAADADKPPVWLEFGWHFEDVAGLGDEFAPAFVPGLVAAGFESPVRFEHVMAYSYGGEGRISFQPDDTNWIFSASVRYGRAHGLAAKHQQTMPSSPTQGISVTSGGAYLFGFHQKVAPLGARFENASASNQETHAIIDFQAGKDVGLGIGSQGSSQLNVGVRFAQLRSHSGVNISGDPDFGFNTYHQTFVCCSGKTVRRIYFKQHLHRDKAGADVERSFGGIGPSVSWNASAALVGNPQDGELALDWGAGAALLFGRQKAKVKHHMSSAYFHGFSLYNISNHNTQFSTARSRRVTVPDLSGFAGISFRYVDAKLSLGYRADFFFGALDGGIDTRKSTTRGFYGPFASINVGLGD